MTPEQLKSAFFAVLATGSGAASVALRAALGAGASSVIVREGLTQPLPAFPFLALQWGSKPSGGPRNRGLKRFYPIWLLYDQPSYRYSRLEALIPLIEAAYPEDELTMCYLDFIEVRELTDEALNGLPAKAMPFEIRTRG